MQKSNPWCQPSAGRVVLREGRLGQVNLPLVINDLNYMKALLQQLETKRFYRHAGQWTEDALEAYDFKSSVTARTYCLQHHLSDVQIVLKFDSDKYDIVLPAFYPAGTAMETDGLNPESPRP